MIPYHVIPWPCYFHDTHCYLISFQTYATHCSLMIPYHVMPCYLLLPYYPTHCYLVILIDTMPCHAMLPPIIPNLCDPLLPNAPSWYPTMPLLPHTTPYRCYPVLLNATVGMLPAATSRYHTLACYHVWSHPAPLLPTATHRYPPLLPPGHGSSEH